MSVVNPYRIFLKDIPNYFIQEIITLENFVSKNLLFFIESIIFHITFIFYIFFIGSQNYINLF